MLFNPRRVGGNMRGRHSTMRQARRRWPVREVVLLVIGAVCGAVVSVLAFPRRTSLPPAPPRTVTAHLPEYDIVTCHWMMATCYDTVDTTLEGGPLDRYGHPLHNRRVVATDPAIIPSGSLVWVQGHGIYEAADVGDAIKGKSIDICIPGSSDKKNKHLRFKKKLWCVTVRRKR